MINEFPGWGRAGSSAWNGWAALLRRRRRASVSSSQTDRYKLQINMSGFKRCNSRASPSIWLTKAPTVSSWRWLRYLRKRLSRRRASRCFIALRKKPTLATVAVLSLGESSLCNPRRFNTSGTVNKEKSRARRAGRNSVRRQARRRCFG